MAAKKPTDTHPVLVGHLQGLVTALDVAFGYSMADDLQRRYRNLDQHVRPSRLTRTLEDQLQRWQSYFEEATRGEEPAEVRDDE